MSLLTEQEMTAFFPFGLSLCASDIRLVRAIESLVIAKIKAQGPAVRLHIKPTDEWPDVKTEVLNGDGFPVEGSIEFYRLPEGD